MWIFTTDGFISAVYKENALQVRARDKKSLERLAKHTNSTIIKTPVADYPYRLETTRELFAKYIADQAMHINYTNFKNEVEDLRGHAFVKPLHKVWDAMHDVEDAEARVR